MSDGMFVVMLLLLGAVVGLAAGGIVGSVDGHRDMERGAIEVGVGQYNATTGEFEWRPAR